ncbi:hypothetical protein SLEP1_g12957 [Rubroshorea leprosula]|uniref:Uncharacterized protein n=1 Tax=Rubroshorea leprosula TaxID=152421 RepID=A0AAV5IMY8_9ROSI|nr:hypothetical protein SLEP1_g12957 [Rubroshorea leprosula]
MAQEACFTPCTMPCRLIDINCFSCSLSCSVMLPPKPPIPALLNMMSSLPFHATASSTADSTSASFATSQCMYRPPMELASSVPSSSSMSTITT